MKYPLCLILLFSVITASAQKDAEKCSDHPLLGRIPDTYITQCSLGNDNVNMSIGDNVSEIKSGNRYYAMYAYSGSNPAPAFSKIVSNYETIILKNGGQKIYYSASEGTATFSIIKKNSEMWIMLTDDSSTAPGNFELVTVESSGKKKITTLSMFEQIDNTGSTVIYDMFEKNKTEISPESTGIIDIITDLLTTETELNLSIEAHTDNSGNLEGPNQRLSENRAKAIYDALILKGIDAKRLKYKGWGQKRPVADNSTEEGRLKNNRIELIKIETKPETNNKNK